MAFPDFPFRKNLASFIRHDEVLQYLDDYANHFTMKKHIQFETAVERVHPIQTEKGVQWEVGVRKLGVSESPVQVRNFDAVIVCNGHYSVPLTPDLPGLQQFEGRLLHSHDYRSPEAFSGLTVLCLGAASSGQDIALDLAPHVKQVILAHRGVPISSALPSNVRQSPAIKQVRPHSVLTDDDEEHNIDVLMFCTGYHFRFPFLSDTCHLSNCGERLTPLYKHLVHTEWPTLAFVGICKKTAPFLQFDCQVRFVLAALDGSMPLPSKEAMEADIEADYAWRLRNGMSERHAHTLGSLQWAYNDDLAHLAGFPSAPKVVEKLYNKVHDYRSQDLPGYKKLKFELTGPDTFVEIEESGKL